MVCQLEIQDGHHNRTNLIYDPIGKIFKNYSYFKFKTQNHLTVNMDECSLDDPLQNINMCFFCEGRKSKMAATTRRIQYGKMKKKKF